MLETKQRYEQQIERMQAEYDSRIKAMEKEMHGLRLELSENKGNLKSEVSTVEE